MRASISNLNLNYDRVIQIAEGTYWIGFCDIEAGLHCNPYLIIDGEEAVVIDGGSRPDFPTVMMKILQTGLNPSSIEALIYQHYDPDLCGSLSNFEDIIDREDLKIITDKENSMFIRHYGISSKLYSLDMLTHQFTFSSGRQLQFFNTPYAHSSGSFITLDTHTGVLFTSDLFGSYGKEWELFLKMEAECRDCTDYTQCRYGENYCPLPGIIKFHRQIMTSKHALRYAMETVAKLDFNLVAPQHGSIIPDLETIAIISEKLVALERVGIDRIMENRSISDLGDITPLMERLKKK